MAEDELRPQVNQNSVDIADLRVLVNDLINNVVRPATEIAVANRQRSEENAVLIQNLLDEARADRLENRRAFAEQQQELRAQREEIREEMLTQREEIRKEMLTQREEMRTQWEEIWRELRAQQQVTQAMLVDLGITHTRLDELEAS
jgi:chromosome segregation ATPase